MAGIKARFKRLGKNNIPDWIFSRIRDVPLFHVTVDGTKKTAKKTSRTCALFFANPPMKDTESEVKNLPCPFGSDFYRFRHQCTDGF